MSEVEQLRVVLSGQVRPGFDPATAKTQLARLMRKDAPFAERLLAGKPTTVKSNVDSTTGKRYVEALLAIGAECRLEAETLDFDANVGIERVADAPTKVAESAAAESDSVSTTEVRAVVTPAADYGLFLLALPVLATLLTWFWVGNMNLLEGPGSKLMGLLVITIVGTAVLAAMEVSGARARSPARSMRHRNNDVDVIGPSGEAAGDESPASWFLFILLLWIVGYPAYLYHRRRYGLSNYLIIGIVVTAAMTVSMISMSQAIESKVEEVQAHFRDAQRQLDDAARQMDELQQQLKR